MPEPKPDPVHINGIKVGEVSLTAGRSGRDVIISARLKVDWPGMWHAAAREADKERR